MVNRPELSRTHPAPPSLRSLAHTLLAERTSTAFYLAEAGPEPRLLYVSDGIADILGCSRDEMRADPDLWNRRVDPRDVDALLGRARALLDGEARPLEYRVRGLDGQLTWVLDRAVLCDHAEGTVVHAVVDNVTERRRTEDLLAAHAHVVERLARGTRLDETLVLLTSFAESVADAPRCFIEALPQDGGDPMVFSPGGTFETVPDAEPGQVTTRAPLISPDGDKVGSLVLHHAPGPSPAREHALAHLARLATMTLVREIEHRRMGESVALLEAALESTEDGILVVDSGGRTAGYNQKFADMWRIAPELLGSRDDARMIGYVLEQLVDPDGFVNQVMQLYESPTETSFDELHFLDGRVFERYSQPQLVRGTSVGRVWSFRDVTDKRRLQRDLELLGSVATASNSAHSLDGALADALSAFCRYGGWELGRAHLTDEREPTRLRLAVSHEHVPGRSFASPDLDEDPAAAGHGLPAAVLRSGRPESITRAPAGDGDPGSGVTIAEGAVSACAFPVLARDEVVGVLEFLSAQEHVCDDRAREAMGQVGAQVGRVVERDRAERRLARHTRQLERLTRELESVLNSAGEGIYGIDAAGTVTFANETAARLMGRSRTDMLGRPVHEVLPMEPREAGFGGTTAGDRTEHPRLLTGRHRRADGSSFDSELIAAPIVEDGVAVGSVVVFRDITERREVDRMKDEFISMVSHELRTPLTSIRGALGLLEGGAAGEIPARAARMVKVATVSTNRLIRLINDILDMERMSAGKLSISTRPVRADELVHTAVAEMTGLAESSGVEIRLGGSLDGIVLADPDRIVQTLGNLLSNAIKFSDAGSAVDVNTTVDDGHVVFRVHDDGRGIPPDQLETVFEQFRQVDGSDTRQEAGTGLGLAICRGLVLQHGGRIWATSELGVGTTFSFSLPSAHPEGAP